MFTVGIETATVSHVAKHATSMLLGDETLRDLKKMEAYFRVSRTAVVEMAVAELARRVHASQEWLRANPPEPHVSAPLPVPTAKQIASAKHTRRRKHN